MTSPNTPSAAIMASAQRLKDTAIATRDLAKRIAEERTTQAEAGKPANPVPQP